MQRPTPIPLHRRILFASALAGLLLLAWTTAALATTTYYSQGSLNPELTSSWNTVRTGGGTAPGDFVSGDVFVIQNGHTLSTAAPWTVSGTPGKVYIEAGGTLTANNPVAIHRLLMEDQATYNHSFDAPGGGDGLTSDFPGSDSLVLGLKSTVNLTRWATPGSTAPAPLPLVHYGHLTINVPTWAGSLNMNVPAGDTMVVSGNFTLVATGGGSNEFRVSDNASTRLEVDGTFRITGGRFDFTNNPDTSRVYALDIGADMNFTSGGTWEQNAGRLLVTFSSGFFATSVFQSGTYAGATLNQIDYATTSGKILQMRTNFVLGAGRTFNVGVGGTMLLLTGLTATNNGTLQVDGTLQLQQNAMILGNSPIYGSASTLVYAGGVMVGAEWTAGATSGPGVPRNVTIQSSSGNVLMPGQDRTVPGLLRITNGQMAMDYASGSLHVGGNWIHTGGSFLSDGRTVYFEGNATQTVSGVGDAFDSLVVNKSGGSITLSENAEVDQSLVLAAGPVSLGTMTLTLLNPIGGTPALLSGGATTSFSLQGSAAGLDLPSTISSLFSLELNNGNGTTLPGDLLVNGTLFLNSGTVNAGSHTVSIAPGGSVTRAAGLVQGSLRKHFATGAQSATFEIGTGSDYTPVALAFGNVSVAGDVTASTAVGDHSAIGSSGVDATRSVNRTWTLSPAGIAFDTASATFNFVPADVDAGANTSVFRAARYSGGTWTLPRAGARTATSTQATGFPGLGDFAVGELFHYTLTTSAGAHGSVSPSGAVPVDYGDTRAISITPDPGNRVLDVLVDGVSVGAVGSYTFTNIMANHTLSATFMPVFIITASAGANGSISPSGADTVDQGANPSFIITPSADYHVLDVLVDGSSVGAVTGYTFSNVTAAHTISATFARTTFVITASAGAGGTISPNGSVVVNQGDNQPFTIAPATGYHVLDVVVDGSSVGAVTSYTFNNVSATHTITASFAINTYTITASAGAHGSIAPAGAVSVNHGSDQPFSITPDTGYHVLDVQVDGGSVGAVTGYTFHNVTAAHTIAATFAINTYTVTLGYGAHGSVSPAGVQTVNYGDSLAASITPDPGYHVADVLVDAISAGTPTAYTFHSISANHTLSASFALNTLNLVQAVIGPAQCISTVAPCVSVPVTLTRTDAINLRGFSVTVSLGPNLSACDIQPGTYLAPAPNTSFQVTDNGGGSYTVDGVILGAPCGATAPSGTLFTLSLGKSLAGSDGPGLVTVTSVTLRDCDNAGFVGQPGVPDTINVDATPPPAVSGLTAATQATGNDGDGTTGIRMNFTTPPGLAALEVYRAPFGNYPYYDNAPGAGSAPAVPAYPPGLPWSLTSITAGGQTDNPPARDFWYYVAFTRDSCGNVTASARTSGTLNYHLGDVHDGVTGCSGNNVVNTSDISYLGAHYGIALAASDPLGCLDVGPTTDHTVNGRPVTDSLVNFEDLQMFSLNFRAVSKPGAAQPATALAAGVPRGSLDAEELEDGTVVVRVHLDAAGLLHGISLQLGWNAAAVAPVDAAAASWLTGQGGVGLSPAPGALDATLLGPGALSGAGVAAVFTFRRTGSGDPGFSVARLLARDASNQPVALKLDLPPPPPARTELLPAVPNPSRGGCEVRFAMSAPGRAELSIYSVDGRRVVALADGPRPAGVHSVAWNGLDASGRRAGSGIYYVRLRAPGGSWSRAITVLP